MQDAVTPPSIWRDCLQYKSIEFFSEGFGGVGLVGDEIYNDLQS